MPLKYWFFIFLLAAGWGSSFFFNEILLRELGPMWVALGRVGMGAIGCWLWMIASRMNLSLPKASLGVLVAFAFFQYSFPLAVYPLAQQYITSSAAGIVNAMTPIMVVLVSHFWPQGEKATLPKIIGVILGFAGITLLAQPSIQGQGASDPVALLLTITAPVSYGIALNLLRRLDGVERVSLTAWSATIGAVLLFPLAFGLEGLPTITKIETWAALLFIGFVLTSAAFILLFWLIPRVGGTTASTITFLAPISSVLLGVYILSEVLFPIQFAGMAVIFSGLLFIDGRLLKGIKVSQPNG
ncbi:MAG: DMT family transporter [Paracoccaceae bacterium]|nr:DMT family transporter [Paracoccaceae bacterium]MDG2258729.1 DMT family transporter [Paracoccaceae bacterium]